MKNAFDEPTGRLDMTKERNSELEEMVIETAKTEKQRVTRLKNKTQNIQNL